MLDRHAVQAMLQAGERPRRIATHFGISVRTVSRIARKPAVTAGEERAARGARQIGRPPVPTAVATLVQGWLEEEPDLPPGEVHRRPREADHRLGLSTVYRLLGVTRPTLPAEVLVRFEGVAGEFAQFDFAEVDVQPSDGTRRRVHFAAYRLTWSRFMHVTLVPNERAEALVRALLAGCAASGGVLRFITRLLPRPPVPGRHHRPAASAGELAGGGEYPASLAGDGGAAGRPPAAGAAPPHTARRGAGGLRPAGPRHGGPHRDGDLPGDPLRDAGGGVRIARDAVSLSRSGAPRVCGGATRAAVPPLPPRRPRVVSHGAAHPAARAGLWESQAALLHARAAVAGPRG
jgi:hypothetical protein